MNTKILILFLLFFPSLLFSQIRKIDDLKGYHSDAEIYSDGETLYTNTVTIQFGETVFTLPEGQREVTIEAMSNNFAILRTQLVDLKTKFGAFRLEKLVPSAKTEGYQSNKQKNRKPSLGSRFITNFCPKV